MLLFGGGVGTLQGWTRTHLDGGPANRAYASLKVVPANPCDGPRRSRMAGERAPNARYTNLIRREQVVAQRRSMSPRRSRQSRGRRLAV